MERGDFTAELTVSDVSQLMAEIEQALVSYASYPRTSLQRLQSCLLHFAKENQQAFPDAALFHSQLNLLQKTLDQLLDLDCPFQQGAQVILLSCFDALFQNAMALQLGGEYQQVQARSLSAKNLCWQALSNFHSLLSEPFPYAEYCAELPHEQDLNVEDLLKRLAEFGRVSLQVSGTVNGCLVGQFSVETSLSLNWLNERFSECNWVERHTEQAASQSEKAAPQKVEWPEVIEANTANQSTFPHHPALSLLALLSVFQSTNLSRHWRDVFLTYYAQYIQQQNYVAFAEVIADKAQHDPAFSSYLVPRVDLSAWATDQALCFYPLRWQGYFYAVSSEYPKIHGATPQQGSDAQSIVCLGRDVLPSIIYQLDCLSNRQHFHSAEAKPLRLSVSQISWSNGKAYGEIEGQQIPLLNSPMVYSTCHAACCLLPHEGNLNVLLVNQCGQSFAIPYDELKCVEALALQVSTGDSRVKNVWLDKKGRLLMEPNLTNVSVLSSSVQKIRMETVPRPTKKGYYFGVSDGVNLVVAADLVVDVNSYKPPQTFYFDDEFELRSRHFVSNLENCVEYVGLDSETSGFRKTNSTGRFSVILEADGFSAVLSFASFDWYESYQSIESLELGSGSELSNDLEHDDLVVLDKKKYLSFITDYLRSV